MNITIRFIFRTVIGKKVRLVDETFECLDDNFSINIDNENINDFSKAIDSKFTKTLKVAGTERAVSFFKEYYEVRYEGENDFSFIFNSRTGEHCIIYVDDVEVMQGVALLTGITKNKNLTIFEIQVINDVKEILNEFKNLYIDELDEFNYNWNFTNVRNLLHTIIDDTFTGICMADGECISQKFIGGNDNAVRTSIDMSKIPIAGNVKSLMDKAFEKIGVEYQSEFFSNSQIFSDLWLCNNKEENLGIWGDEDKVLLDYAFFNLQMHDKITYQKTDTIYDIGGQNYTVYINSNDRNISYWNILWEFTHHYQDTRYHLGGMNVYSSESLEFDNYINYPPLTTHIYLAGGCKYKINMSASNFSQQNLGSEAKWRGHIIFKFTDLSTNSVETINYYNDENLINADEKIWMYITLEKEIEHNTILDIYLQEDVAIQTGSNPPNEINLETETEIESVNVSIWKIAGSHVRLQGSNINLYSQLPHISVYDLIVNLQKMFNLVFSLDKDTEKLIIEPEVDYYKLNEANLIDITNLVDYSQDIVIEPASTLIDYNKISAKYNISDKDFHNSYCLSQYGRAFGEFKTEFESYAKDELEIKNEFTLAKAAIYPFNDKYIFTANYENENGNLKKVSADKCFIGVRKVHTNAQANELLKIWYNENIHGDYNHSQYNYLDFCSADFDYSYDTPRAVFTNMEEIPFENLFFNYYYKVLQEYITLTGKVVRLKAYFDPLTFSSLSKKRIVYWQNNYWKLLKISDWSPKKSVVSVTLLKMIDVEVPKIEKKPIIVSDNWQFGGWIKPLMIDTDNVSVDFLETLGRQGVMISNKAGSINLNEIAADTVRYLTDGISKYDKYDYSIIECLLPDGTEIEFPDYTNFDGLRAWPVVEIKNAVFRYIKFTGDFIMNNLEIANDYEFYRSVFTGSFNCPNLKTIGVQAFRYSEFSGSFICPNLRAVGNGAFLNSEFTGNFNCPDLKTIGYQAFANSQFTGSFNCPDLQEVGNSAFENSSFNGTFNCQNLQTVANSAFYNSNFTTITIGANANLGTGCVGAHSTEFIQDYADNGKQAGTYVWDEVTQHWIYQ